METLKIVLAMLALVLIGFIGGFATHRHLAIERIHDSARRPGRSFERHLERVIQADETQREQLRPIIEKWQQKQRQEHDSHKANRVAKMDSMVLEMRPFLNPSQIEQVDETLIRFREHERRPRPQK